MLWSIECFDFNVLLFKEFCFIVLCVCMCVYIVIVKYSLYLSGF